MTDRKKQAKLSLGNQDDDPRCLSKKEPDVYETIAWTAGMVANPTVEKVYQICGTSDDLAHMKQHEIKAAIHKVLHEKNRE